MQRPLSATAAVPRLTSGTERRAVLVFARSPRCEARAKGLPRGRRLFELGRDRVLGAVAALPGVALVVVGDAGAADLPDGARVLEQRGGDFGERLENAFADVGALGYDRVVAVGIDAPRLSPEILTRAFTALESHGAVLGPAADGGAYLIGLRGPVAGRFDAVPWRTGEVLAALLAGCRDAALLPVTLHDVDSRADARALRRRPSFDAAFDPVLGRALSAAALEPLAPGLYGRPPVARPVLLLLPLHRRGPPVRHLVAA